MAYFGVDKEVRVKELVLAFQNTIRNRMTTSVRYLAAVFADLDHNGSGCLSKSEFEQGLAQFG